VKKYKIKLYFTENENIEYLSKNTEEFNLSKKLIKAFERVEEDLL
jgi:hypothetical protein